MMRKASSESPDNPAAAGAGVEPADPPTEERLYLRAARKIAAMIVETGLEPGQRLPSEADLAETLHVSRATVREAVVALDVSGVVQLRRSASATVRDPSARLIDGAFRREGGPFEILKVRRLIEPEAAQLAAQKATRDDCDAMEAAIERMLDENQAGFRTEHGDRDFHLEIAKASGNSVLAGVIADLWRMRQQGRLWSILDNLTDISVRRSRAVYEHMRILEAIRAKAPERAAEAMGAHIDTTYQSVLLSFAVED